MMNRGEWLGLIAVAVASLSALFAALVLVYVLTGCAIAFGDHSTATVSAPVEAPVDVSRPKDANAGARP